MRYSRKPEITESCSTSGHILPLFLPLLFILLPFLSTFAFGQGELGFLEARRPDTAVAAGVEVEVEIVLLDAFSEPLAAAGNLEVVLEARRESSEGLLLFEHVVFIPTGSSSAIAFVTFPEAGIIVLRALHPQYISREFFMMVVEPGGSNSSGVAPMAFFGQDELMHVVQSTAPSSANGPKFIKLVYSTNLPYLANGDQGATINVFLYDASGQAVKAQKDTDILLTTNHGQLDPEAVRISEGEHGTVVVLRADRPGLAQLAFHGAVPSAILLPGDLPPIEFTSSVLRLEASPSTASLLESSEIIATLYGSDGIALAAPEDLEVHISLASENRGRGTLVPSIIKIPEGRPTGRADFIPSWTGTVTISAISDGIPNPQPAEITVMLAIALGLLAAAVAGGIAGAAVWLFSSHSPRGAWPGRILVGILTGFLMFWAVAAGAIHFIGGGSSIIAIGVTNPISAFALALVGGYAGARVLTPLLLGFGLKSPKVEPTA